MLLKKILLSLLFVGVNTVLAQTITVNSNADSGPGTLREALQTAASNGTTNTDIIQFSLPGNTVSDRTIRLRTALPVVTSNVIIDGSTQSGAAFGVSGAKIIIEPENSPVTFSGLVIGALSSPTVPTSNVEIYGLYIRRFANITNLNNVNVSQGSGILLDYHVQNITIGKPGKGNVLCGNYAGILLRNNSFNSFFTVAVPISIQGNMIGVMDDGTSEFTNFYGISADIHQYNLTVGGDGVGEGNVIAANATNIFVKRAGIFSFRTGVSIVNNKIGVDYTGQKDYKNLPIFLSLSSLEMYGIRTDAVTTDINIHRNVISGQRSWAIAISNSDFSITGNYIGTNANGTVDLGNNGGIRLEAGSQGTIGGTAVNDLNYIGFNRFGVETVSAKAIQITRNSIFCNSVFGIGKTTTAPQAFIQVLKRNSTSISGKASSNAEIELFYTDNCVNSCQGKTFIASVRADNAGRWVYTGTLNAQITGTATISSATTSSFADAGLLDNEAVVTPITCNGNGSITISEPREGIDFKWYKLEDDGTAGYMTNTQSVTNLVVGTYEVRIFAGCKTTSHKFFITDQVLTKPIIIAPTPQCNQTSFTFSASVLRGKGNITYSWYDASGTFRGNGATISLPAGTYTVKAKDESGCEESATAPSIAARPAPKINLSLMTKPPSVLCGSSDGYIKNIVVTPAVGTATYKWFRIVTGQPNEEVGQLLDLENVPGGNYILEVTDQSTCSPVSSGVISIATANSVIISATAPKGTTCNSNNGEINNILVSNANYYEFSSSAGILQSGNFTTSTLSFTGLAPGNYTLFAKNNNTGCSNSRSFTVNATPVTVYTATGTAVDATCNLNNGSVKLTYSSQVPTSFQWRNAQNVTVPGGTALEIKNLAPGSYTFHAFDNNGCPSPTLGPFTIINTPLLAIVSNSGSVFNDGCGLKKGSITGVQVVGGVQGYRYEWIDQNNVIVQNTEKLVDVGAGAYRLRVFDQTSCGAAISEVYTIADHPFEVSTPIAQDIRVCYATDILIAVKNKEEGKYQLFKDDTNLGPILESETGTFAIKVKKTGKYFLKHIIGTCESAVSSFTVEVINDNLEISNTMTPNGDGINDIWVVKGLPDYKNTLIQLFNRSGQMVYENRGNYDTPFNGVFRGAMLPAGVYYYNIDLKADCKPIAGSLTILR